MEQQIEQIRSEKKKKKSNHRADIELSFRFQLVVAALWRGEKNMGMKAGAFFAPTKNVRRVAEGLRDDIDLDAILQVEHLRYSTKPRRECSPLVANTISPLCGNPVESRVVSFYPWHAADIVTFDLLAQGLCRSTLYEAQPRPLLPPFRYRGMRASMPLISRIMISATNVSGIVNIPIEFFSTSIADSIQSTWFWPVQKRKRERKEKRRFLFQGLDGYVSLCETRDITKMAQQLYFLN